jgi:single-strand DNA-binding protein
MAQLNKVFLMGNLTRDPELRRLANGTAVTDLGLALNRSYLGKDGEKREEVVFIDVTVWDRQAETCCQYLKKGRAVHVEGFLKMDTWDDKTTGEKRSKFKVQADRVQFLDRKDDAGGGGGGMGPEDDYAAPPPRRSAPPETRGLGAPARGGFNGGPPPSAARRPPAPPVDAEDDDDIPF